MDYYPVSASHSAAVIEFWNVTPHLETSLEIYRKTRELSSNKVLYYHWGKNIRVNQCYIKKNRDIEAEGIKLIEPQIGADIIRQWENTFVQRKHLAERLCITDISPDGLRDGVSPLEGIIDYRVVYSALIDITRCSIPACTEQTLNIARNIVIDMINVFSSTLELIRHEEIDQVILFNGRFHYVHAAYMAAKREGCKTLFHERSAVLSKYILWQTPVHNSFYKYELYQRLSRNIKIEVAMEEGQRWVEKRIKGIPTTWYSFTKSQIAGYLPKSFNERNMNIVMFLGSEYEIAYGVDDRLMTRPVWNSQVSALTDLIWAFSQLNCSKRLYIRLHPHMCDLPKSESERFNMYSELPNVEVIANDSSVDTYTLLGASNIRIVYSSTVGLEGALLGHPCLYMGAPPYQMFNCAKRVTDPYSLLECLKHDPFNDEDYVLYKQNASRYVCSMLRDGYDYEIYKPHSLASGAIMGKDLNG